MSDMIVLNDVTKSFLSDRSVKGADGKAHRFTAVEPTSLSIKQGEIFGLMGYSGAGKSTLLRLINMLERPDSGQVIIDGTDLTTLSASDLRIARHNVGMIFQQFNLMANRTVFDNVAFNLTVSGYPKGNIYKRVMECLEIVDLTDRANYYPAQLSGGQKQRVGIARAIAPSPKVLLADEPTSALDPRTTDEILDLIKDIKSRLGLAVLVITHEMHVVKRICDSVSLLEAGLVVESGPLADVVGTLGSRLGEVLLQLPPSAPLHASQGIALEVLDTTHEGEAAAVTVAERHFGVDLSVLAGVVEHLGGTTFSRMRILVPPPLDPGDVKAFLIRHGAQAAPAVHGAPEVSR